MTGEQLRTDLARSEQAFLAGLDGVSDDSARGPSRLPGWTRGHVLTHLARNAETFADALDGVRRGEIMTMYGGSVPARNDAIQAGAGRPAAALVADVEATSTSLHERLSALTDADWAGQVRHLRGVHLLSIEEVLGMRWQEVEVHRVDLDLGYRPVDWPEAFVRRNLPVQLERLPQRAPDLEVPDLPPYDVLAWLYGRGGADLPELPPWP